MPTLRNDHLGLYELCCSCQIHTHKTRLWEVNIFYIVCCRMQSNTFVIIYEGDNKQTDMKISVESY